MFPQGVRGKCQRPCGRVGPHIPTLINPTPRAPVPTQESLSQALPSVAVNFHGFSWGVLSALMEAGTPFQSHTLVLMPDLRERNPNVLGAIMSAGKTASATGQAREPTPQLGLSKHVPLSTQMPPPSAGDTPSTLCPHTLLGPW